MYVHTNLALRIHLVAICIVQCAHAVKIPWQAKKVTPCPREYIKQKQKQNTSMFECKGEKINTYPLLSLHNRTATVQCTWD